MSRVPWGRGFWSVRECGGETQSPGMVGFAGCCRKDPAQAELGRGTLGASDGLSHEKLLLWIPLLDVSVPWQAIVSDKLMWDEYLVKIVFVVSVPILEGAPSKLRLGGGFHTLRKVGGEDGFEPKKWNQILDCTGEYTRMFSTWSSVSQVRKTPPKRSLDGAPSRDGAPSFHRRVSFYSSRSTQRGRTGVPSPHMDKSLQYGL